MAHIGSSPSMQTEISPSVLGDINELFTIILGHLLLILPHRHNMSEHLPKLFLCIPELTFLRSPSGISHRQRQGDPSPIYPPDYLKYISIGTVNDKRYIRCPRI